MIEQIRVIGLGLGHADHLTSAAVSALRSVDVFLLAEEGEYAPDRNAAQRTFCEELGPASQSHRFAEAEEVVEAAEVSGQRGQPASGKLHADIAQNRLRPITFREILERDHAVPRERAISARNQAPQTRLTRMPTLVR